MGIDRSGDGGAGERSATHCGRGMRVPDAEHAQMAIECMRSAASLTRRTNTHPEGDEKNPSAVKARRRTAYDEARHDRDAVVLWLSDPLAPVDKARGGAYRDHRPTGT